MLCYKQFCDKIVSDYVGYSCVKMFHFSLLMQVFIMIVSQHFAFQKHWVLVAHGLEEARLHIDK